MIATDRIDRDRERERERDRERDRDRDRDRITVKIHNMKRSSSRDSRGRKRRRHSPPRYTDSSDERITPDRMRRPARSPSPRGRYASPPPRSHRSSPSRHSRHLRERDRERDRDRDEYPRATPAAPERSYSYKALCIGGLHPKIADEAVKEALYREYKKYGEPSVRIVHEPDERVAYVCFRSSEDARDAKRAKSHVLVYDKLATVDPVYERSDYRRPRSVTPPDYDPDYYLWAGAGAAAGDRRRATSDRERPYPPQAPPPHRDFRPLPAHAHHEYPSAHPLPLHHRPPLHHQPHPHPHPHPHYLPRPYLPRPHHPPFEKVENKKDKFPNYLHHVQPEDDPLATRTLFAGNLEINISDEELRRIFGRFGVVEDIDIKRPPPGTGNAFAFVRYQTLDMAHRAKVELSGQYIGKFQCKIGYGKATPTTRVWVGGLGPWTSVPQLEREFDRFGAIKKIEYAKGESSGYISYDSIDAAQAAVKEMRGFPLGGPDRRLRIDFADAGGTLPYRPKQPYPPAAPGDAAEYQDGYENWEDGYAYGGAAGTGYRGRGGGGYRGGGRTARPPAPGDPFRPEEEWRREEFSGGERGGSGSPVSGRRRSADSDSDGSPRRTGAGALAAARTLPEIARKAVTSWTGALVLKNSLFPAKFHLTDGDPDAIDGLMKDEDGKRRLRITQRLRLDQPKLDDVRKRISTCSSHSIFLGLAGSTASVENDDSGVQTRPLRNLVSYLKQKEAAGVISLLNKETEATGVLYSFPPCEFSTELLKKTCHNLTDESLKDDHLVIVVVRGGTA